jgi:hypothetical protein
MLSRVEECSSTGDDNPNPPWAALQSFQPIANACLQLPINVLGMGFSTRDALSVTLTLRQGFTTFIAIRMKMLCWNWYSIHLCQQPPNRLPQAWTENTSLPVRKTRRYWQVCVDHSGRHFPFFRHLTSEYRIIYHHSGLHYGLVSWAQRCKHLNPRPSLRFEVKLAIAAWWGAHYRDDWYRILSHMLHEWRWADEP